MHPPLLSHDLHVEFPDLAARVDALRADNAHFAQLFDQYNDLDGQITRAEEGLVGLDDFSLEDLKKRRLKVKDEIYDMLRAG